MLVGSHREVVVRGLIGEMRVCVLVRGLVGLVVVLLDVPLLVLSTGLGEMITASGSRGTTDHVFPLVVLVLLPWDMGNLVAREWCLLSPLLSRWLDTGSTFLVLTPVSSRWLILVLISDCRQEDWRTFG
jgi:hypothetical protein